MDIEKREKYFDIGIKFRAGAFPGETWESLNNKYDKPFKNGESWRCFVRRQVKKKNIAPPSPQSDTDSEGDSKRNDVQIQIHKDGSQTSTRLVEMAEEDSKDVKFLLHAHGYDPYVWELVSARNNIWNVYSKKHSVQTLYSSKILVKPKSDYVWNEEDIREIFNNLETKHVNKKNVTPQQCKSNGDTLVVAIADLHYGLLSNAYSSGNDYDLDIAEETYYHILNDVIGRVRNRKFEKVLFVIGNDAVNCDNVEGTTTAGTPQDNASLWFNLVLDATQMFIDGIDMLLHIAPVDVQFVASNHDLHTMFGIVQTIRAWYRNDDNVRVFDEPLTRKYHKIGSTLLCLTHDIRIKDALKIVSTEAKVDWSSSNHIICFIAHKHQAMVYEKQGYLEIYRLPTPSGWSRWTNRKGYVQSEKKNQSFIINNELGITDIINTVIMRVM